MTKLVTRLAAGVVVTALSSLAVAAPAHAGGGDAVIERGSCSNGATWKLKAKPDDGRIEIEAEVDSNVAGQHWQWALGHNGSRSASGTAQTQGASGSFTIQRSTVDAAGTDRFRFRATHDGATCVGRIRL